MTFLEHRRRLLERNRFFGQRTPSFPKVQKTSLPGETSLGASSTGRKTPPTTSALGKLFWKYRRRQIRGGRRYVDAQLKSKLNIDVTTAAVMKLELEDLLSHNAKLNIETTALSVVNAFIGSKNVVDLYAESMNYGLFDANELDSEPDDAVVLRSFGGNNPTRRHAKHMNSSMQRKYDFINSMNELQEYACSVQEPVISWNDALVILSRTLQFHPDVESNTGLASVESADLERSKAPLLSPSGLVSSAIIRDSNDIDVGIYIQRLRSIRLEEVTPPGLRTSQQKWIEIANTAISKRSDATKESIKDAPPLVVIHPVAQEDRDRIQRVMSEDAGNDTDIVAVTEDDTDSVQRYSLRTLRPYEWLNDEVIHYFLVTLQRRDVQLCREQQGRKHTHFFKSFFMTKLLNEGNPALEGTYTYSNVKRWSKKVPGKDIFNLNKIVFPINQGNQHWTSAVVFVQEQKIQYFDSLGGSGKHYLQFLFKYIQDEHLDKRKSPLKSPELWSLVPCTPDTPRQQNGYDCGVFTCLFADWISMDRPLEKLSEKEMLLYREHIALSILDGQAK